MVESRAKTPIRASAVESIMKHHFEKGPAPYPTKVQIHCSLSVDPMKLQSKGDGVPYEHLKSLGFMLVSGTVVPQG